MSGPGEAKLQVAEATDMRLEAFLARIVSLILTFPSHLAAVPLGAGGLVLLLTSFLLFLLPLLWLRNSLDRLHHGSGVNL